MKTKEQLVNSFKKKRKDLDAGKDWRQEKKGTTEDEMVGWHHWLDGHEFEQAPELVMDRSLAYCSPWGCKELGHDWVTELTDHQGKRNNSGIVLKEDSLWSLIVLDWNPDCCLLAMWPWTDNFPWVSFPTYKIGRWYLVWDYCKD